MAPREEAPLPAISIVTVAYKAAATIEKTIDSVASQSLRTEHIVVDGGSGDGTRQILERRDADLARWVSEPDGGLYDAMNKGAAMASGDYVGFLNADDHLAGPDVVAAMAGTAADSGADMLLGDVLMVRPGGRPLRYYSGASFRPWQMRFGHMPPHPGLYVRRELLLRYPFRTDIRIGADFEQILRLLRDARASRSSIGRVVTVMQTGGLSTSGFSATRQINRDIADILSEHGVTSAPPLLWARYGVKALQYLRKPRQR